MNPCWTENCSMTIEYQYNNSYNFYRNLVSPIFHFNKVRSFLVENIILGEIARLRFLYFFCLTSLMWATQFKFESSLRDVQDVSTLCIVYYVQYGKYTSQLMFIVVILCQLWPLCFEETRVSVGRIVYPDLWMFQNMKTQFKDTARLTFDSLNTLDTRNDESLCHLSSYQKVLKTFYSLSCNCVVYCIL